MDKLESIEDFYKNKFNWIPESIKSEIGHFNVFEHEPIKPGKAKQTPYRRRDFHKIMLVVGPISMNYADKVITVKKQALFFSNPFIPYNCENLEKIKSGYYCIFNQHFFNRFGDPNQYSVFQPKGNHVFELTNDQAKHIGGIFHKMMAEIGSDYIHKYDVLRNLVYELVHFGMKIDASAYFENSPSNASQRISTIFLELLERQFPIDENHPKLKLRTASDFANQLNVHVNHLNRSLKSITEKTTTELIADRILQESKIMLKHSNLNVSEIAFSLGFTEVTHFNNFFKKHTNLNPLKFRNQ
jgi:AraC family transcriptional regulator, transcriptional activator of pobA